MIITSSPTYKNGPSRTVDAVCLYLVKTAYENAPSMASVCHSQDQHFQQIGLAVVIYHTVSCQQGEEEIKGLSSTCWQICYHDNWTRARGLPRGEE